MMNLFRMVFLAIVVLAGQSAVPAHAVTIATGLTAGATVPCHDGAVTNDPTAACCAHCLAVTPPGASSRAVVPVRANAATPASGMVLDPALPPTPPPEH